MFIMQSFYFTLLPFRCVHLWKIPHIFAICKNGRSKFFLPIFEMTAAQPVIIAVLSVCSSEKRAQYYLFVLNINKTIFWIQYNTEGMWYWKLELVLFWGESKRSRITWHYCICGKGFLISTLPDKSMQIKC